MLKSLEETLYHTFFVQPSNEKIIKINLPNYYNFGEMLDIFTEMSENDVSRITLLTVKHSSYKIGKEKGFHTLYLYDYLDFNDNDFFVKEYISDRGIVILENADSISYSLVMNIAQSISQPSQLYVMYDSFIPRKYLPYEDVVGLNTNQYEVSRINSDKNVMNVSIRHYLNSLRDRGTSLDVALEKDNNKIPKEEIAIFDIAANLDLNKVIITPHRTFVRDLNWKIREFLGFTTGEDIYLPREGEWLIVDRAAEAAAVSDDRKFTLPTGYRLRVSGCRTNVDGLSYEILFDYLTPDGELVPCLTYASRRYFEFLATGNSELMHSPYSYCLYYAYVVPAFYSINNEFDDGIVLYDRILAPDKKDLYSCILPIKKDITILFNKKGERMLLK